MALVPDLKFLLRPLFGAFSLTQEITPMEEAKRTVKVCTIQHTRF